MGITIKEAGPDDREAMLALLPRLAAFELPPGRSPEHLWRGDAALLEAWLAGEAPRCFAEVAVERSGEIVGLTLVSLREEPLSGSPGAHLEVIAVAAHAERRGIGASLMASAERRAAEYGALTMSLHVFSRNERARLFYESAGYDDELIRYIKAIGPGSE